MTRVRILFSSVLLFLLSSCSGNESEALEQALQMAGDNRAELEKVLAHYSHAPADSLKLRAAVFLIENMPGHYSYDGDEVGAGVL